MAMLALLAGHDAAAPMPLLLGRDGDSVVMDVSHTRHVSYTNAVRQ
jgi:hypothetical protein